MRKTRTIPSHSITSIANWWAKPGVVFFLVLLAASSCRDDAYLIGFPSPDANFKISFREFAIPTHVVQIDSVISTNGGTSGETNRLLVGSYLDNTYGNTASEFYTQYFPKTFPVIPSNAKVQRLTLTLVFDYYHRGGETPSTMNFEAYQLSDSMINTQPYFTDSELRSATVPLGTASKFVSPGIFDQSIADNEDADPDNNIIDSLTIDLATNFGERLLSAARDTVGSAEIDYNTFRKFRQRFTGLVIKSPGADKIVGFNPAHAKSRLTLHYVDGATPYQIEFSINPAAGISGFSKITTDRSGTALAGIPTFVETVPPDNLIYTQCGTGLVARLDFSEVYNFFRNIPIKALSVAELSIRGDVQEDVPTQFYLRNIKANNRFALAVKKGVDNAYDTVVVHDTQLQLKHLISGNTIPRLDPIGDDGQLFLLRKTDETSATEYKGYLTNFMQRELLLGESETLNLFALVPYSPEFGKSLNGVRFPKDKVVLRIYYTTPAVQD